MSGHNEPVGVAPGRLATEPPFDPDSASDLLDRLAADRTIGTIVFEGRRPSPDASTTWFTSTRTAAGILPTW